MDDGLVVCIISVRDSPLNLRPDGGIDMCILLLLLLYLSLIFCSICPVQWLK